jgi:serine/threonine protein kinase
MHEARIYRSSPGLNESARLRFLREVRAGARLRNSNVSSVLYLAESGGNCFYAMGFVEGEMLETLIKRKFLADHKVAGQGF